MPSRRTPLGVLALGLLIASCVGRDLPTSAGGGAALSSVSLQPALIPSPADGDALPVNRIRAIVTRSPDGTVLLDTRVDVSPTAESWTLDLSVPLPTGPTQARIILYLLHVDASGVEHTQFSGESEPLDLAAGSTPVEADVDIVRGPVGNLYVTGVTITSAPASLEVGASAGLEATVTTSASHLAQALWTSLDPTILTVSGATATGVAPGMARVVASAGAFSDTVSIEVLESAPGGTNTWIATTGTWSTASSWSLGRVPGPGDVVHLTQGVDYTVTLDVDATVERLVIGGTSDVISLHVGDRTLTLTGSGSGPELDILPLGGLVIGNGVITAADVSNQGSVRGTGATGRLVASTFVSSSSIVVASDATLDIGHATLSEIHTTGTVTVDAGGTLIFGTNAQWTYAGGAVTGGGIVLITPGSALYLEADLAVDGPQIVADGAEVVVSAADRITIGPSSSLSLLSLTGQTNVNPKVVNHGLVYSTGPASYFSDSLYVEAGASLQVVGAGSGSQLGTVDVVNAGSIVLSGAADATFGPGDTTNRRILNLPSGDIVTLPGATRFINGQLENQGSLRVEGPTELHRRSAQGTHVAAQHVSSGTVDVVSGELAIVLGGAAPTFTNTGTITVEDLGTVSVTNLATPAGAIVNAATGVLRGNGTIRFNPGSPFPDPTGVNNGTIAPGLSPGILTWQGQVPMGPTGRIEIELAGTSPGTGHDQLNATTDLILDLGLGGPPTGSLVVTNAGYTPADGDRLAVMTFRSRIGNFATVTLPSIPGFALDIVWAETGSADTLYIVATSSAAPAYLNAWIDADGGNWSAGSSWSKGVAPVASDSVVIALDGTYTVTLDVDATVRNLMVGGGSGIQTLEGGSRALTLDGPSTIGPNGQLTLTGSDVMGAGPLTNQGLLTLFGTSMETSLTNEGTISAGAGVDFVGSFLTSTGSMLRVGEPAGNALLTVANGFTNNGTIELTSTTAGYGARLAVTTGSLLNSASGIIHVVPGAGGSRTLTADMDNLGVVLLDHPLSLNKTDAAYTNSGTIDVVAGDLTVAQTDLGIFTNLGSIQVAAGRTWALTGGILDLGQGLVSGAGTLDVGGGATLVFTAATMTAPLRVAASTIPGGVSVPDGETLTLLGGTAIGDPIVNAGTIVLTGTVAFDGPLTSQAGSTLRLGGVAGPTVLTVANGFTNDGTIELTSTTAGYNAQLAVTTGTLLNSASGTLAVLPGAGGARTLAAELDNQGTLLLEQPLTIDKADAAHVNSSVIDVGVNLTVTQTAGGSFSNEGAITIGTGATWAVTGGTLDLFGLGTVSGPGTLDVSGGATLLFTSATTTVPMRISNVTVPDGITVIEGDGLTLLGGTSIDDSVTNFGTIVMTGSVAFNGPLTTLAGSVLRLGGLPGPTVLTVADGFTNDGTIELTSTTAGYNAQLAVTTGTLINSEIGTLAVLAGAGGARTLAAELDNQGAMRLEQPLTIDKPDAAHRSTATIDVGANLTVTQSGAGSFTNDGVITIPVSSVLRVTGGTLTLNGFVFGEGLLDVSGATLLFSPGTTTVPMRIDGATIPGGLAVTPLDTLRLIDGTSIDDPITNGGAILTSGSVSFNGTLTTQSGSSVQVGARPTPSELVVASGFTNFGSIELTSTTAGYNAQLVIPNGTLTNANASTVVTSVGAGGARIIAAPIDNSGTLTVLQNTTMTSNVEQRGSLTVSSGTLTIQGVLSLDFNSTTIVDGTLVGTCVSIGGGPIFGGGLFPDCP